MTKAIIGSNLYIKSEETSLVHIQIPAISPRNEEEVRETVTQWAEYNYANSSVWLIPNVMQAIVSGTSTKWIVPIMSYDGPTGEVEHVELEVFRA